MKPPVIIIGAGRSGTNALRDALCSLKPFHTWPCDEINYIWRSGNRDHPNDELVARHATDPVCRFIHRAFEKRAQREPAARVVEKTCANALRVGFVDRVFPDSLFVHIVRDGRDVTSSAMKRWTAQLDIPYLARKARFVPVRDAPHYAIGYLRSRLARRSSSDERLATWGPRFDGLDELTIHGAPLDIICASQWAACATRAIDDLGRIDPARVHFVRYEDLIADPVAELRAIVDFSGEQVADDDLERVAAGFHGTSAGAWRTRLDPDAVERIAPIVDPVLRRLEGLG